MKIALVCDDLVQHGGHEKVVMDMCRLFPGAPLYTTVATKTWQIKCEKQGIELRYSFLQKVPFKKSINRILAPFMFYVIALEQFDFDEYDLVISLSSRFAHGILTKPQTKHICYMSTVGRMIWEPHTYFEHEKFWGLRRLAKAFLSLPLMHLRIWDLIASNRPDYFLANSLVTQARIKKYYKRDSIIVHPAIDISVFNEAFNEVGPKDDEEKYFFVITRLASWKKVEIAIKACADLGVSLKIAGDGPDLKHLKKVALENLENKAKVEFLGYVSDEEKIKYLRNCQALIMTQYEDFGITPLEAMACGSPVVAYKKGGVLETVIEGETGSFYDAQTSESLASVLETFSKEDFDLETIKTRAKKFDISEFNQGISEFVKDAI